MSFAKFDPLKKKMGWDFTGRMADAGWMEQRKSGPRGGRRFHITEQGRFVLQCVDELGEKYYERLWPAYPEMLKQFKGDENDRG